MSVKGKAVLVKKTGPPDMDLADALTRSVTAQHGAVHHATQHVTAERNSISTAMMRCR